MTKHKWHKEIKAWADGEQIQFKGHKFGEWIDIEDGTAPEWNMFSEYRIKPQPKEQKYLIVWLYKKDFSVFFEYDEPVDGSVLEDMAKNNLLYIGKIKLEVDDD
jgi:hypothetical protein